MELIFKNKFASVQYERSKKLLFFTYTGIVDPDSFVEVWKKAMEFADKEPVVYVLNDAMNMKGTFTKVNNFLTKEVTPYMEQRGEKYAATALSSDVFTIFAFNQFLKLLKSKIEFKVFKNMELANAWLEEKMAYEATL